MTTEEKSEHESYGMLLFSRVIGGSGVLFGSPIDNSHSFIRLRISRGTAYRSLNRDWYSGHWPIIEVDMSPAQFAEAITTMNCGDGIPCTIRYKDGKQVADCPRQTAVREKFEQEFDKKCKKVAAKLKDDIAVINQILEKKTLNKEDRKLIADALYRLDMEVGANMPFVQSQFNEAIDKTVTTAKTEIDAFMMNRILMTGQQALVERQENLVDAIANKERSAITSSVPKEGES